MQAFPFELQCGLSHSSKTRAFMSYVYCGLPIPIAVRALPFVSQCEPFVRVQWGSPFPNRCVILHVLYHGGCPTRIPVWALLSKQWPGGTWKLSFDSSRPLVFSCNSGPCVRGREAMRLIHIVGSLFLWLREGLSLWILFGSLLQG